MIAVDIETAPGEGFENFEDAALDFHRCKITVIATWSKDGGKAFTNISDYNEWYEAQGRPPVVGHNFKFDLKPLKRLGAILPDHWEDTSLMAVSLSKKVPENWLITYEQKRMELNKGTRRAVHRRAGGYSLKTLAPYFLGVQAFWEVEDHANIEYALKDAEYTYRLYYKLKELLEEEGSYDFYSTKILPWAQMLVNSEYEGITLDVTELQKEKVIAAQKAKEAEEKLHSLWADAYAMYRQSQLDELSKEYAKKAAAAAQKLKDPAKAPNTFARYQGLLNKAIEKVPYRMNIGSPTQLTWLFKNYLKLDITDFSGDESTGKPVLQRLAGQGREDIQTFLDYRKYQKLSQAFFPSYEAVQWEGKIHTNFNITGTRTGRLSSSGPNCLSMDTDVMTTRGFIKFPELLPTDKVAVYHESGTISWEIPSALLFVEKSDQDIIEYENDHINFKGTADHRTVVRSRNIDKLKIIPASEMTGNYKWVHSGLIQESADSDTPDSIIQLAVAVQADATDTGNGTYRLSFLKQRKIDRFISLFSAYIIRRTTCTRQDGRVYAEFYVSKEALDKYNLLQNKQFNLAAIQKLSRRQLKILFDEVHYWDGLFTRKDAGMAYVSKFKHNIDVIQFVGTLLGYRMHQSTSYIDDVEYYRLYGTYRDYSHTANLKVNNLGKTGEPVWCLKVSTGMFIARRGNNTFVTGNCQQIPSELHKLFIASPGKSLLCYDLAGIEPVMIAYITEDPIICDLLISGKNFHTHNTKVFFGIEASDDEIKAKFKKERDLAKEVGLALLYGAGPRRLQESAMKRGFNWSIGECKKKHEAFKEEYQYIYKYKKNLDSQLEDGGMIRNVLGRPVKIEDPENVYMTGFNTLIQSSASDMLIHSVYKATKIAPKSFQPLLFVHDEIIAEVADEEAEEAQRALLTALEGQKLQTPYGLIPVNAEGGIFKYWKK